MARDLSDLLIPARDCGKQHVIGYLVISVPVRLTGFPPRYLNRLFGYSRLGIPLGIPITAPHSHTHYRHWTISLAPHIMPLLDSAVLQ